MLYIRSPLSLALSLRKDDFTFTSHDSRLFAAAAVSVAEGGRSAVSRVVPEPREGRVRARPRVRKREWECLFGRPRCDTRKQGPAGQPGAAAVYNRHCKGEC